MKYLISVVLFMSLCFRVYAAPAPVGYSGTYDNGSSVTVSGSGFDTFTTVADTVWLGGPSGAIESGTTNAVINLGSGWSTPSSASRDPIYSTSWAHSGSKSILTERITDTVRLAGGWSENYANPFQYDLGSPGISEGYVSFWMYWTTGSLASCDQFKILRIQSQAGTVSDANGSTLYLHKYLGTSEWLNLCDDNQPYNAECYPSTPATLCQMQAGTHTGGEIFSIDKSQATRVEYYWKENSSLGASDGSVQIIMHEPNGEGIKDAVTLDGNLRTRSSSMLGTFTTGLKRAFIFQGFIGNNCNDAYAEYAYYDDIYIAKSRARIELGNASTWDGCSRREIQKATSWSATSVSFEANTTGWTTGQTAWLYVVDKNGLHNTNGVEVEIGASSAATYTTCYQDADSDLYGHGVSELVEDPAPCSSGYYVSSHFTALTGDCNDGNANINPSKTEICGDGIDQDCSGADLSCSPTPTPTPEPPTGRHTIIRGSILRR